MELNQNGSPLGLKCDLSFIVPAEDMFKLIYVDENMYKSLLRLSVKVLQAVWNKFFHFLEKPTCTWSYNCIRPTWYQLTSKFGTGKDKLVESGTGGSKLSIVKGIQCTIAFGK